MLSNVRRVAERQQWAFRSLEARLAATEAQGRVTGVDADVLVQNAFDDAQLATLHAAAETCRISRALNVPVTLRLSVAPHA